jgi:hypothetical protein
VRNFIYSILACLLLTSCGQKEPEELVYEAATREVLKYLKVPSSAKFPDYQRVSADSMTLPIKALGVYNSNGYVDSQNAMGVMLRNQWSGVFRFKGDLVEVLFLTVGDNDVVDTGWYDLPEVVAHLDQVASGSL